jgi:hypothetical protein
MSAEVALGVTVTQIAAGAGTAGAGAGTVAGAGVGAGASAGGFSLGALVPVATVAGTALVAGAAAVLVTRAAVVGAEALAEGMINLHEHLERQRGQYIRLEEAAALWREATSQVMARNARIGVLRRAAPDDDQPGGPDDLLPPPLEIGGESLDSLVAWCQETDKKLEAVRARQARARIAAARRRLAAAETDEAKLVAAGQALLDRRDAALAAAAAADQAAAAERVDAGQDQRTKIDRALDELDPLVDEDWDARVQDAAARAAAAGSDWEAQSWLRELRVRVQKANAAVANALAASHYLQAIAAGGDPEPLPPADQDIVDRLQAVIARQRPLDDELRRAAERLQTAAQAAAERRYLQELVGKVLEDFGYTVGEEFVTVSSSLTKLTLSRPEWRDHLVEMVLREGELRAEVVRTSVADGDDDLRLDTERQKQWCIDLAQLKEQLKEQGISTTVERIVKPGDRPAPVVGRPREESPGEPVQVTAPRERRR